MTYCQYHKSCSMAQKAIKELEVQGCRKFVCPNISLIDEKGKELSLKDRTIKRAKELAMKYFKDTYRKPHYSSARHLLPSFICIASIMEGDKRSQKEIAEVFGTTNVTITKWNRDIVATIGLDNIYIYPDLDLIDEGGRILGSDSLVIKKANELATKYFNNVLLKSHNIPTTKTILPSLLYLASIIENDRKTQMEIAMTFNISESHISQWYKDITDVLGMKIIYGYNRKVLKVLEEKDDS
jgi:transcription initiation factor TFIIIB Brf1 subunit/transcription initiation factor TFIIB